MPRSGGARAYLLRGMWDLPRPGIEPESLALAGVFSLEASGLQGLDRLMGTSQSHLHPVPLQHRRAGHFLQSEGQGSGPEGDPWGGRLKGRWTWSLSPGAGLQLGH